MSAAPAWIAVTAGGAPLCDVHGRCISFGSAADATEFASAFKENGIWVSAGTWIGLLLAVMLGLVAAYVLAEWRK